MGFALGHPLLSCRAGSRVAVVPLWARWLAASAPGVLAPLHVVFAARRRHSLPLASGWRSSKSVRFDLARLSFTVTWCDFRL